MAVLTAPLAWRLIYDLEQDPMRYTPIVCLMMWSLLQPRRTGL